ncbi:hypothetical protein ACK3SF_01185 [Candidatus Nanosalina sp. VS9-1]|uniref:hypothetical protein n=1 Tax=Candidatus Nanosalina sp. VS9-1 TaxID=3388566 RepID=UPI0039E10438
MSRGKKTAFAAIVFILGLSAGLTFSYMSHEDERQARNYCMDVEQGLQDQMDQGFVNCMLPGKLQANLSEEVEERSNLRCVCRRKIGENVEVIQITTAK